MRSLLTLVPASLLAAACSPAPIAPAGTAAAAGSITHFQVTGRVVERYGLAPIVGATVTIADGEDAGKQSSTDGSGRFVLDSLVTLTLSLRVTATDFEARSEQINPGQGEVLLQLDPLFREELVVVGPGDGHGGETGEYYFAFESHHMGPVSLALHSDCPVPYYGYSARLNNRLWKGSINSSNFVFGAFLADGELADKTLSRTDTLEARVVPPRPVPP